MSDVALNVAEVRALYIAHAMVYYRRKDGTPTREHLNLASSLTWLEETLAPGGEAVAGLPIAALSRTHVKLMRLRMIAGNLARSYINKCVSHVRRFLRWASDDDVGLCPTSVLADVAALKGLPAGRSAARETKPRTGVPWRDFNRTLEYLTGIPRVVCVLLALTGARVGEILSLTTSDLNMDAAEPGSGVGAGEDVGERVWWAFPKQHKTAHRGSERPIPLDARCQRLLLPLVQPICPQNPLFPSPRTPTRPWRRDSIAKAVGRACKAAGVSTWTLHQVRHQVCGEARRGAGLDEAQALMGHKDVKTTQGYAPVGNSEAVRAQAAIRGVTAAIENNDQMRFWG